MAFLRQPIISVLGHVDHGKTSLLDFIRNSKITNKEAGGITQHIGATEVPKENIIKISKDYIPAQNIKIPGLLFIDTPGHKAFNSLRKRGGNICDIGILIVDINEGFKPQTIEAIEILKNSKTPFVVAANKLDLIHGFSSKKKEKLIQNIEAQREDIKYKIEEQVYNLVGKLSEKEIESDRFDRIDDFTKKIAIVPISAKTGEGIPELISTLIGLTQKFFENKLTIEDEKISRGVILEVKNTPGLGTTIDAIIHDGILKSTDNILALNTQEVEISKIKSLLKPADLKEIRDKGTEFKNVKEVQAASGIKISAPELKEIQAGMPFITTSTKNPDLLEIYKQELLDSKTTIEIQNNEEGILVKADTLGSLEALNSILKENEISIRKAKIGKLSKSDILDVAADIENNPKNALILAFNLKVDKEIEKLAKEYNVTIIKNDIIYKLIDDSLEWIKNKENQIKREKLSQLVLPFKFKILNGCIFRTSKPAVVGIEVLGGTLKKNITLINQNNEKYNLGIKSIKLDNKDVQEMKLSEQGAVSIEKLICGKNGEEGTIIYSFISSEIFKKLKQDIELLTPEEKSILKEYANMRRNFEPNWGR